MWWIYVQSIWWIYFNNEIDEYTLIMNLMNILFLISIFVLFQVQAEIRLPKNQGIAGHVATTGEQIIVLMWM